MWSKLKTEFELLRFQKERNCQLKTSLVFLPNLQPDLSGALFCDGRSVAKTSTKKAGAEGGKSCPNKIL